MTKDYGHKSDSGKTPTRDTAFAVIKHRVLNNHDKCVQEYRWQDGDSIKKNQMKVAELKITIIITKNSIYECNGRANKSICLFFYLPPLEYKFCENWDFINCASATSKTIPDKW